MFMGGSSSIWIEATLNVLMENVKPIKKMVGAYALETGPRPRPGQLVPMSLLVVVMLLSFCMGSMVSLFAALQLGLLVR